MAQGRTEDAIERHQRAIALNPELVAAYLNLGNALNTQGRRDDAIGAYRQAIADDPNHAEAHNNLGGAHLSSGALSEAAACFERALALKPDFAPASVNLIKTLVAMGDLEGALRFARQAHGRHETAETRAMLLWCLRDPRAVPFAADYRDYLIRAIAEPWGTPHSLAVAATSVIRWNPAIAECVARGEAAWPVVLVGEALFGVAGVAPIAQERLLRVLLESVQNFDPCWSGS